MKFFRKKNLADNLSREEKTRNLAVREGAAISVMLGTGDSYLIPYAMELQASNLQTGLISSLGNFFGPLAQLLGSRLMEKYHRKTLMVWAVLLQSTVWILFIGLGVYYLNFGYSKILIALFILAYIMYSFFGALAGPPWFSMIGDVVPEKIRGKYFSHRNKIIAVYNVAAVILAALILSWTKDLGLIIYGFIALFAIAGVHRYLSAFYLSQHYVGELKLEAKDYFSFTKFLKKIPERNFNRFALYVSLFNLTAFIANPFLAVYLWKGLDLNPVWFTAIIIAPGLFSYFFLPAIGRLGDKYGNRELLRLGTLLIIPQSLLWLLSSNPLYLILIPQLIGGLGWSAFNLAASNFIFDSVKPSQRGLSAAYYNILNGLGMFIGTIIGGLLIMQNELFSINTFVLIFIISAILKALVFLIILPLIAEVRTLNHQIHKNPFNYFKEIRIDYGFLANISYLKKPGILGKIFPEKNK